MLEAPLLARAREGRLCLAHLGRSGLKLAAVHGAANGRNNPMNEDMLTKMARAMLGAFYDRSEGSWDCSRDAYIRDALPNGVNAMRAAVAVQREPDEAMLDAGDDADPFVRQKRRVRNWQAMIDAMEGK